MGLVFSVDEVIWIWFGNVVNLICVESCVVWIGSSEAWFDPDALIESDGEDEFYSVQDG